MNSMYIYIFISVVLIIAISFILYYLATKESFVATSSTTTVNGRPFINTNYTLPESSNWPTFSPNGGFSNLLIDGAGNLQISAPVPVGTIVMWASSLIPNGWSLCDGTNGTPDLRSKFIVGASSGGSSSASYRLNDTGGEESHTLTIPEIPSHSHSTVIGGQWSLGHGGGAYNVIIPGNNQTGVAGGNPNDNNATVPHNNLPPFYALYYIMKIA